MAINLDYIWKIEPLKEKIIEDKYDWKKCFTCYAPTGSRYICSPPVMNTDEDWVVYTKLSKSEIMSKLEDLGFEFGGSYTENGGSFRRGDINLIVVTNYRIFRLWVVATALARRFNLLDKNDRIALFEAVVRQNLDWKYDIKRPEDWI